MAPRTTCPYGKTHTVDAETLIATERMLGLGGEYRYARCSTCGSLWLLDPPADLSAFYSGDYYSFEPSEDPGEHPVLSRAMRMLLRAPNVARRAGRGRYGGTVFPFAGAWFGGIGVTQDSAILDVGSGAGTTLARLRWLGFRNLTGIDPFLASECVQIGPIEITRRALDDVEETYDVVLFNHVLEHVADPIADLAKAAKRLRPGGHVLVFIPLVDSASFERYGAGWAQLDAPRHLTIPTRRAIEGAVGDAGLRVVDHWRDSHDFQFWASEQYERGISLYDERSWYVNPERSSYTPDQIKAFKAEARRLNREGRGDQGGFILARA